MTLKSVKEFKVGDSVFVYFPNRPKGTNKKMYKPWRGPYKILQRIGESNYVIDLPDEESNRIHSNIHVARLKAYNGAYKSKAAPNTVAIFSIRISRHISNNVMTASNILNDESDDDEYNLPNVIDLTSEPEESTDVNEPEVNSLINSFNPISGGTSSVPTELKEKIDRKYVNEDALGLYTNAYAGSASSVPDQDNIYAFHYFNSRIPLYQNGLDAHFGQFVDVRKRYNYQRNVKKWHGPFKVVGSNNKRQFHKGLIYIVAYIAASPHEITIDDVELLYVSRWDVRFHIPENEENEILHNVNTDNGRAVVGLPSWVVREMEFTFHDPISQ